MIRLSIQREKRSFTVSVELMLPRPVFIQAEDINIFAAVDEALKVASRSVKRTRGKRKQR